MTHAILPTAFRQTPVTRICTAMNKVLTVALGSLFAAGVMFSQIANAASDCEAKALSKDGKPLAGAAKTTFIKNAKQMPRLLHRLRALIRPLTRTASLWLVRPRTLL